MKKTFYLFLFILTILLPLVGYTATTAPKNIPAKNTAPKPPTTFKQSPQNIIVPEEEAVIAAYEKVLPGVVSIVISEEVSDLVGGISKQDTGGGTGFFAPELGPGYIITNKHVVLNDKVDYTVVTSSGEEYVASVLARDPLFDLAIVKVEGANIPPLKFADSDKIRIGQTVLAIGNVLTEFRNTLTRGIVSGVGRTITASGPGVASETIEGAIQTDASINPGNSGGPLINLRGEVIGINTAINRAGESLGFAIPINRAKQAIKLFKKYGEIKRTFLGVRYVMLNRTIAKAYNLITDHGAYVIPKNNRGEPGILPDGPADQAGLKGGDVVLEINGKKLTIQKSLAETISDFDPNQEIELKVLRSGTEMKIKAKLGERNIE